MDTYIRDYREEDRLELEQHMEDFQRYLMALDPEDLMICPPGYGRRYMDYLLHKLNDENGAMFIAVFEESIVGFVALVPEQWREDEKLSNTLYPEGRVIELYVSEIARGKGVGSLLMSQAETYARAQGWHALRVGVFSPNGAAHAFYQKLGYADRNVELFKTLGTGV